MQPPNRGRPTQPGRGRAPARWTGLEIALITLSVLMIAYPLVAGTARLVAPPLAPAQESTPPPTETPDPAFEQPPTEVPPPSETPLPSATPEVPPTETAQPQPEQVGGTATSRPITPTSTTDPNTPTPTNTQQVVDTETPTATTVGADTPTPTSTTDPNISPTSTSTTDPNISPTPTLTQQAITGVRVFKVASVSEVNPGQSFSYSVSVITDSATDQQVTLTDNVDANLEVLSASSASGSCTTGQTVSCSLTLRADNPASVTIQVRVRATVTAGTTIGNSASAGGNSSGTVNVRVIGGPVSSPTVTPTGPTATPSPSPTGPTATPTPTLPGGITNTPTSTPTQPAVPITNTPTSVPPPPPPPPPTTPPEDDDDEDRPSATEVPPAPPAPPTPIPAVPTEPPTPAPVVNPAQPVIRPTAAVRPTRVPQGATSTAAPLIPVPTGSAQPTGGPSGPAGGGGTDIFFRLASDWGSAYPGQQVNFTLAVRNTRGAAANGANDLRNLTVRSNLPGNLEVLGARADRGSDPVLTGNEVSYTIGLLQPGEGVEITVATRIRPDVTIGTLLVAQGQLTYEGLAQTAFSNIVSVQVVGNAQPPTAAAVGSPVAQAATGTAGTAAYPPPSTGTPAPATATAGRTPSPQVQPPRATVVPPTRPAPLPETSAGVPMLGIALLGATLLTRTWRLHRAKDRL